MGKLKISNRKLDRFRNTGRTMMSGCPDTLRSIPEREDKIEQLRLIMEEKKRKDAETKIRDEKDREIFMETYHKLHPDIDKDIKEAKNNE